jgi:hypothetical protein
MTGAALIAAPALPEIPSLFFLPTARCGGGLLQMPHGLTLDASGNVWVTDNAAKDGRGMQVKKLARGARS